MNERIRELAEQATEVKWLHDGQYALVMPEKFAQLIVQECMSMHDEAGVYTKTDMLEAIGRHFGVEK